MNGEIGLRVRNLLNDHGPNPVTAVDNGSGSPHLPQRIYLPSFTFELSSGLRF